MKSILRRSGRRAEVALALVLAFALLLFWELRIVWPGREAVFGYATDILWYFLPSHTYIAERFRKLALPVWNPFQGAGQPFLATIQPGALYPARLLLVVLDVPTAMHVSTVGHLLVTAASTYVLCRLLAMGPVAAAVGAAVFTGGFSVHYLYSPSYLEPGAWLPLGSVALVQLTRDGRWRWVILLALAAAMPVLAGGYQMSLYVLYGLALLGLALLLDAGRRCRLGEPATLLRLAVAGVLAFGTAAPQLFPALAWSSEILREPGYLNDAQIMVWPTTPWDALGEMFIPKSDWSPFYLSVPVAVLAGLGFLRGNVFGAVLGVGVLAMVLLALGWETPVFPLYRLLPGLAMLRNPMRLEVLAAFGSALGAGLGMTALARTRVLRGRVGPLLLLSVIVAVLYGPIENTALLPWTVTSRAELDGPPEFLPALRQTTGDGRALLPPTLSVGLGVKLGTVHHIRVLQDYEPLASRRLAAYLYAAFGLPAPTSTDRLPFLGYMPGRFDLVRPDLLDLVAIRSVGIANPARPPAREPPFTEVFAAQEFTLYANPQALPRAYTVGRARFVDSEAEALAALVGRELDARREAVLLGQPALPEESALASGAPYDPQPARIALDLPEKVVVAVEVDAPSVLVLADAFAPGWQVSVDGASRRLWQVNHLVRGVLVRPGERQVEFSYRAPGLRLGFVVAALVWTAFGLVVLLARRGGSVAIVVVALAAPAAAFAQFVPADTGPLAWPDAPPSGIPFARSRFARGITFTGPYASYCVADTYFPSWGADGKLYSPFMDGVCHGVISLGLHPSSSMMGTAVISGEHPTRLEMEVGTIVDDHTGWDGRYASASLNHDGIWYYGSYLLAHAAQPGAPECGNLCTLGPFVGFAISRDSGRTWEGPPHTADSPLFGESTAQEGRIKLGALHVVDFGQNNVHAPGGYMYLVGHGGGGPTSLASWVNADHIYLVRVKPTPETVNDRAAYEYFAGWSRRGCTGCGRRMRWSRDLEDIVPLLSWPGGRLGTVTISYDAPLRRYLMWISAPSDGVNGRAAYDTMLLESRRLGGRWRLVHYLPRFGPQAYFAATPTKFMSADGRRMWLGYSANYANESGEPPAPAGSGYSWVLRELELRRRRR